MQNWTAFFLTKKCLCLKFWIILSFSKYNACVWCNECLLFQNRPAFPVDICAKNSGISRYKRNSNTRGPGKLNSEDESLFPNEGSPESPRRQPIIDDEEMKKLFSSLKYLKAQEDKLAENWKMGRYDQRQIFTAESQICKMGIADSILAVGCRDGTVSLVDINTRKVISAVLAHNGAITALTFDEESLLTGSSDGHVRLLTLSEVKVNGERSSVLFKGHTGPVTGLSRINETHFASAGMDGRLLVWNQNEAIHTKRPVLQIRTPTSVTCLHECGGYMMVGLLDGTVLAYSPSSSRALLKIVAHDEPVQSLCFASKDFMVTGSSEGSIRFWNLFEGGDHTQKYVAFKLPGEELRFVRREFHGHSGAVTSLQADKNKIASASTDGSIRVWNLETGNEMLLISKKPSLFRSVLFNEKLLITDSAENCVMVHDFTPSFFNM